MKYKIFDETTFSHFMTKLKESLDSKQSLLGYTPVNKSGDTMTGTLTTTGGFKSENDIYEFGEKLSVRYGSKSILDTTANTVNNLVGQVGSIDVTLSELKALSRTDLHPALSTDAFLRGDGAWATPPNTKYTAGSGLKLSGTVINHTSSITAGNVGDGGINRTLSYGGVFRIPTITYDSEGHISNTGVVTLTIPDLIDNDTKYKAGEGLLLNENTNTFSVEDRYASKSLLASTIVEISTISANLAGVSETVGNLGDVSRINKNNNTGHFLRGDGNWVAPKNDIYSAGTGLSVQANEFKVNAATKDALGGVIAGSGVSVSATGVISVSTNYAPSSHVNVIGNSGHIPAAGTSGQFLAHNGAWAVPKDTTYKGSTNINLGAGNAFDLSSSFLAAFETVKSTANSTAAGLGTVSSININNKNNEFLKGDGTWGVPAYKIYKAGTGLSLVNDTFVVKDEYVKKSGDTMTGALDMSNKNIIRVDKLGVGTAAPATAIDVVGDIRASGEIQFESRKAFIKYNNATNSLSFRFV